MKNKGKIFLTIGLILVIVAVIFILIVCGNPQMSFPWSNAFTYGLYCGYGIVTILFLVLAIIFKRREK